MSNAGITLKDTIRSINADLKPTVHELEDKVQTAFGTMALLEGTLTPEQMNEAKVEIDVLFKLLRSLTSICLGMRLLELLQTVEAERVSREGAGSS